MYDYLGRMNDFLLTQDLVGIVPCDAGSSEDGYILDNELQRRLVKPLPAGSQLTVSLSISS